MTTSRLALVVLATGLLCVGNAVGQDEQKVESDADVIAFEAAIAEAKAGDAAAMFDYVWALNLVASLAFYVVALSIPLSSVLAHVRYRWNDSYVNFATAMNVLYLGVFLGVFFVSDPWIYGVIASGVCFLLAIPFGIAMIVHNVRHLKGGRFSPLICFMLSRPPCFGQNLCSLCSR